MRTAVQALIVILLVITVILGIYMSSASVFGQAGGNITDSGENSGGQLDCVLSNPTSADSACSRDTSMEETTNYGKTPA